MHFNRTILAQAVTVAALCLSANAYAVTADLTLDLGSANPTPLGQSSFGNGTGIGTGNDTDVSTGAFTILNGLDSFIAYCFQPFQPLNGNMLGGTVSYDSGSVTTNATMVNRLFNKYYSDALSTYDQAIFQTALWELAEETTNTFNVNSGSFSVFSSNIGAGDDPSIRTAANQWLGNLSSADDTNKYTLTQWVSSNNDSQALVSASLNSQVPEPATALLVALGLGLGGMLARRKKHAA